MVGSSVTFANSTVFVFGGRLSGTTTLTANLWALSLQTLTWELLWQPSDADAQRGPTPRYFHSATSVSGRRLAFFGGEAFVSRSPDVADSPSHPSSTLEALSDLFFYDIIDRSWIFPTTTALPGVTPPSPRFAALAVVRSNKLYILGGQQVQSSRYVHNFAVLRLCDMIWERSAPWALSVGQYRSFAAAGAWEVRGGREQGVRQLPVSVEHGDEDEEEEPIIVFSNAMKSDEASDILPPPNQAESSFAVWALDLGADGIACVDLEAFGIYQPPPWQGLAQTGHSDTISSTIDSDYEVFSGSGDCFHCSRSLLEHHWPTFKDAVNELVSAASAEGIDDTDVLTIRLGLDRRKDLRRGSLRITPNRLDLPIPSDATRALLSYFGAQNLVAPTYLSLDTLASLLIFTSVQLEFVHLRSLVVHALHEGLSEGEFEPTRVYELAVKGACAALKIRAVRAIMTVILLPLILEMVCD
ncbi:hypothetical protein RQP46_007074 [Phenoliferia psychrophenolica]